MPEQFQGPKALEKFLDVLGHDERVLAIVLFGSAARGELTERSDLDLLIVVSSRSNLRKIRRLAKKAARIANANVSPQFYTAARLRRVRVSRPSFACHIVDEGRIVYAKEEVGGIRELIGAVDLSRETLRSEIAERRRRMRVFWDFDRFNGEFAGSLARLYSIGRSVVITKLLGEGVHEYSWRRVFDAYERRHPALCTHLRLIGSLRPFYDYLRGQSELPAEDRTVDEHYVRRVLQSIDVVATGQVAADAE